MEVDGKTIDVKIPSITEVKNYFKVIDSDKRVNIIGFSHKGNEANIKITKNNLLKKYGIDKNGKIYRVEFYDKKSFCGMFLVKFKE